MKKISAILFDIDGTLLDTREFIYQSFEYAFKKHTLVVPPREELAKVIGIPLEKCYSYFYPDQNPLPLIESHRLFQEKNLSLSAPFPHTLETLQQLKEMGLKIGAITTRSKRTVQRTLELAKISPYFDTVVTAEDVTHHKPDPEPLQKALTFMSEKPENTFMVGDTTVDILAGKNGGTGTIGVTYGFAREKIRAEQPDYVIDDIWEVVNIVKGN